jgi:DNA modification methylase
MTLKPSEIKPNPSNPRTIKDDKFKKLVQSLKDFPEMADIRPVVVNKDHVILGGNMRFKAMQEAGWTEIPVTVVDWDEDKQREFIIKDNISGGDWDWDVLANEWDSDLLDDWGLDLPASFGNDEVEEDEAPEVSKDPPQSVLGAVYQLGRHRVMCGDSTDKEQVEKLMDGKKADIGFTSPPYNVGTNAKLSGNKATSIRGSMYDSYDDNNEEYYELLEAFNHHVLNNAQYSLVNLQILANNKKSIIKWLYSNTDNFCDIAFWKKTQVQPAMAEKVMNSQTECIFFFGGNGSRAIQTGNFRGTVSNIIDVQPAVSNENKKTHSATMPVEVAAHFVSNFSTSSVIDLFAGTGTTLIACEQTDRTCYGMELDPKYVDVIRKRYSKLTNPDTWETEWETLTPQVI